MRRGRNAHFDSARPVPGRSLPQIPTLVITILPRSAEIARTFFLHQMECTTAESCIFTYKTGSAACCRVLFPRQIDIFLTIAPQTGYSGVQKIYKLFTFRDRAASMAAGGCFILCSSPRKIYCTRDAGALCYRCVTNHRIFLKPLFFFSSLCYTDQAGRGLLLRQLRIQPLMADCEVQ